jgi:hypothetical protein
MLRYLSVGCCTSFFLRPHASRPDRVINLLPQSLIAHHSGLEGPRTTCEVEVPTPRPYLDTHADWTLSAIAPPKSSTSRNPARALADAFLLGSLSQLCRSSRSHPVARRATNPNPPNLLAIPCRLGPRTHTIAHRVSLEPTATSGGQGHH